MDAENTRRKSTCLSQLRGAAALQSLRLFSEPWFVAAVTCGALAGCAHIDFGGPGLAYFEPVPYLQVSVAPDCTVSTAIVVLPGTKRYLKFVDGYGSAQLSVNISNGIIASVGQTVDNGGAAAIAAAATIATAFAARRAGNPAITCGVVALFPIVDGVAQDQPTVLPLPGTPASGPGRR